MEKSKLKIPITQYVSNPWEMLLSIIGKFDGSTLHKGKEVYCSKYRDGAVLTAFRNPHIASGNVLSCKNVYHDEFVRYFSFTDNICVINSYDNDIMDRLQGADFDSDTILLSNNPILVKKGKKCKKYLTPINKIEIKATKRKYNNEEMAEIDIAIVDNKVGQIVNLSQQYNSYYFHELNSGNAKAEKLKEMYDIISKLSSLSQVEIDKPKKYYEKEVLNMLNELTMLRKSELVPKKDNGKTLKPIKPLFFKLIDDNKKSIFEPFDCPMDYLQDALKDIDRMKDKTTTTILDFLDFPKNYDSHKANKIQIDLLKEIVEDLEKKTNEIWADKNQKSEARKSINTIKDYKIHTIRQMKMGKNTILNMFNRMYSSSSKDVNIQKYKLMLLGVIYEVNKERLLSCLHEKKA